MDVELIFGPPGTGKTTALMGVLDRELERVDPNEIAYVSFTKEGSYQGRSRAMERFGFKEKEFPFFRTLHSMAFQSLDLSRSMVVNKDKYRDFSDKMGMHFTGYYTEDLRHDDDMYLFYDELHRNNPKIAATYIGDMDIKKLTFVRKNYRRYKEEHGILDFTDMIEIFCKKNIAIPVRVAIIDEAQDLTTLQWRMVWTAFRNCERVYIAGDDDQAIYQWSGADVDYFLGIEGKTTILKHSYRLPDPILRYAKHITKQIKKRVDKDYEGTGMNGFVEEHNSLEDIQINSEDTYMFLSRNNTFLNGIEEFVMSKGVLYRRKGAPSATSEDYKAITTYEKCRKEGAISTKDEIVLHSYLKEVYSLKEPWYESFDMKPDRLTYFRDLVSKKVPITDFRTKIGTIHSVKGDEADHVIILMDITRNVLNNLQRNPDSEHRAFYVGCTRAKKSLHIVYSNTRYEYRIYGTRERAGGE